MVSESIHGVSLQVVPLFYPGLLSLGSVHLEWKHSCLLAWSIDGGCDGDSGSDFGGGDGDGDG